MAAKKKSTRRKATKRAPLGKSGMMGVHKLDLRRGKKVGSKPRPKPGKVAVRSHYRRKAR